MFTVIKKMSKKSYSIYITFQHLEKTLTDFQIDKWLIDLTKLCQIFQLKLEINKTSFKDAIKFLEKDDILGKYVKI